VLEAALNRFVRGLCAATALLLAGLPARAEPLRVQPVAEGVWFAQGEAALGSPANRNFISNAGFVVTREGVLVVDGLGSPALARELLAEIRRITPLPLRYVVVTHYHADHVYGLQVLQQAGAQVVAHRGAADYLGSDTARLRLETSRRELAPWVDEATRLVVPDRWIDGSTTLELGGERFELRHAGPAHTPEDLVLAVPSRGVLFAGDLVFRGRVPFVGQADSRHWIESLGELIALAPQVVVPGHGPLSREPLADLALTRDYLQHLRAAMGRAAAELEPFEDAYARTDWSRFEHLPLFRAPNRMNAYNTYLLLEQTGGK
jgi:glyoxylase-like metal-dependent hydrolase (beta-lactamase superfamily II)